MKKAAKIFLAIAAVCLSVLQIPAGQATLMAYPQKVEQQAKRCSMVAKVQVLSIEPPSSFPAYVGDVLKNPYWQVKRAKVKIISIVNMDGSAPDKTFYFYYRSATYVRKGGAMLDLMDDNFAHCDLEPGKSYLLFLERLNSDAFSKDFRQAASQYGPRGWEGFFPCSDNKPTKPGISVSKAVWAELAKNLNSNNFSVRQTAAFRLLDLSAGKDGGGIGSDDFGRKEVLTLLFKNGANTAPLDIVTCELQLMLAKIGASSPYMGESPRNRYLHSRSKEKLGSWAAWSAKDNLTIAPAFNYLVSVANTPRYRDCRHLAIWCLGGLQTDKYMSTHISKNLARWLQDKDPDVRAAAIYLSADYPTYQRDWASLATSKDVKVRQALYYAMGCVQRDEDIVRLQKGLKDKDANASASAALSIMVYPVAKVQNVLLANLKDDTYGEAFAAKLAGVDGEAARDALLSCLQQPDRTLTGFGMTAKRIPFQNGLGTDTRYLCVNALCKYLDDMDSVQLTLPEFGKYLDGLESVGVEDASFTGKVYELLRTHRMDERAEVLRKRAKASQPGLPAVCFDQVDMLIKAGQTKIK